MSYEIQYGYGRSQRREKEAIKRFKATHVLCAMIALCMLLYAFAGKIDLHRPLFVSGENATMVAVGKLTQDLRAGEPFSEAITAFCSEILSHAQ